MQNVTEGKAVVSFKMLPTKTGGGTCRATHSPWNIFGAFMHATTKDHENRSREFSMSSAGRPVFIESTRSVCCRPRGPTAMRNSGSNRGGVFSGMVPTSSPSFATSGKPPVICAANASRPPCPIGFPGRVNGGGSMRTPSGSCSPSVPAKSTADSRLTNISSKKVSTEPPVRDFYLNT